MTKQIFCLNQPRPLAIKTADGYAAYEIHTLASAADRVGAPKSSVHRWIQSGDLPAKVTPDGRYHFQSHHLEQVALRIRLVRAQKLQAAAEQTRLSAVLADPAKASDDELIDTYIKSTGETATRIWTEVSKRYRENPYHVNKTIDGAIRRNQEAAKTTPVYGNVFNKANNRTERVRIR